MLSQAERLSATEFSEVYEKGRVLRHPLLQLRMMQRCGEASTEPIRTTRAAFVAPKKLGKAVVRNRLRRRVRERYRLLRQRSTPLALPVGCDLIWIIGASASAASITELDGALGELLRRAVTSVGKNR